jgi:hypothetical protein
VRNMRLRIRDSLRACLLLAVICCSLVTSTPALADESAATRKLAIVLSSENNHTASAIEWRRLAMKDDNPDRSAGYYWASAYEYWQANDNALTAKMIDRSEAESRNLATQAILLRATSSLDSEDLDSSQFYFNSLLRNEDPDTKSFASLKLAETMLLKRDTAAAEKVLTQANQNHADALISVKEYKEGRDKSPRLGGLLGMIPGLGYAYSGEYANAFRSLILNGIFIYGMADTASDEEWGAFTAITFFELTWYTGSIYGGVDSAHRYNHDRLQNCIEGVRGNSGFSPDLSQIPAISLKFRF